MPNDSREIWRPVVGFDGHYEVSSLGRVRSIDRYVNHPRVSAALRKGRIIKTQTIWSGYEKVCLSQNGRPSSLSVHRLVCEAFHGPCPGGMVCAHKNGVRNDNRSCNLRWSTNEENEKDKVAHGTVATGRKNGKYTKPERTPRGELSGQSKLTEDQVLAARRAHKKYKLGAHLLGRIMGVSKTATRAMLAKKTWSHVA